MLREEFPDPMGITPCQLAKDIHVPQTRISAIMAGERGITVDTGLRLDRFLDFPTGGGAGSSRTAIGVGRSGNSAHGSRGR